jgi:hypothetical protein
VDPRPSDSDPDRPSRLGRKAIVLAPILVVVGIVLLLLQIPGWIVVGALVLFLIWLLIDG